MTRFGLDSTGPVPVWAHHAAGSTVALRYLSRSTFKVVTASEHAAYRKAGIDLVLVFEDSGRPDLAGYDGGKADAEFALRQAHDILGTPALPACIRFAADYDPAGHPERTDAYYDGVAAVIPRAQCGPYGANSVIARQADRGFRTLWQTYAWSGGAFDTAASAYQYSNAHMVGGVGVDFNHLYGEDFGQWDRKAPAPPPPPTHYERFYPGPFATSAGQLAERAIVQSYDKLRAHPLMHRSRLRVLEAQCKALEAQCKALAERIAYIVALQAKDSGHPANYLIYWRGWRYQQLIGRAQGKRFV